MNLQYTKTESVSLVHGIICGHLLDIHLEGFELVYENWAITNNSQW